MSKSKLEIENAIAQIAALKEATTGLSYKNNSISLTGPAGGSLAGNVTALTWDAQGNIVVPTGKFRLGNNDLQSVLDSKQPLGNYASSDTLTQYVKITDIGKYAGDCETENREEGQPRTLYENLTSKDKRIPRREPRKNI